MILAGFAVLLAAPFHLGLATGQASMIYAALSGLALASVEARRPVRAGIAVGLLMLKPTLCVWPIALLFLRRQWNTFAVSAALAAALFVVPFLFLGLDVFSDYRKLANEATRDSFRFLSAPDQITAPAIALLNWNGYVASVLLRDPPHWLVPLLSALTVLLMVWACLRGSLREAWLASTCALVLVVPHLLSYDWVLLFPAAFASLTEKPTRVLTILLLVLYGSANFAVFQGPNPGFGFTGYTLDDYGGLWAVPVALALLIYLAFRPKIDVKLGFWGEVDPRLLGHTAQEPVEAKAELPVAAR